MNRTQMLANTLRNLKVPIVSVTISEMPEVEDDEIRLSEYVSIQVGAGYAIVGYWTTKRRTAIAHLPERDWRTMGGMNNLLLDIAKANRRCPQ